MSGKILGTKIILEDVNFKELRDDLCFSDPPSEDVFQVIQSGLFIP